MGVARPRSSGRRGVPQRLLPLHCRAYLSSNIPSKNGQLTSILQADNDFLSTQGIFDGQPFNGGLDNDNQFLVFRVTLPTVAPGSVQQAIGI